MTKTYYWKIFLKSKVPAKDRKYQEIFRDFKKGEVFLNPQDYTKRTVGYLDFDTINPTYFDSGYLDSTYFFSALFPLSAKNDVFNTYTYIRGSRAIKENFVPPTSYEYPFMDEK